jgi:galactonate dehydratase
MGGSELAADVAEQGAPVLIERIILHPLRAILRKAQRTSQGDYPTIEILVAEVHGSNGLVGWGEGLCRRGVKGYASLAGDVLVPPLLKQDARDRRRLWKTMRSMLTGRPGGQLVEAIAAIDIALWDLVGRSCNQSIASLLGGMGRKRVAAYASSINWLDDATAEDEIAAALKAGFREIKVKTGLPVKAAIERAKLARRAAGDDVALYVDANWIYDVDEAMQVGRALADLGYAFFEEPIVPHDRAGYAKLAQHLPIRLAAGESDFVASDALNLLGDRSIGLIQPDVARAGGITETWRIAELAASFHTAYAPHVGWSGGICVAASLQLAAAAETTRTFECMVYENPLRDAIAKAPVGEASDLVEGQLAVPQGPGLGIEIDRDVVNRHRVT